MAVSIDAARADVQRAFERVLELAERGRGQRFYDFEVKLWTLVLALGRALVGLFLARQALRPRDAVYRRGGVEYVLDAQRTSSLGTRFGKVDFTRPAGRRADGRGGPMDLVVDRRLGLGSGFTVSVVMAMTRLCAQLPFGQVRDAFRYFHEWVPSPRAVLRMVDAIGDQARPFLELLRPPRLDGDVLVIQVDGRGAPMIGHREHRRRRGRTKKRNRGTKRQRRRENRRAAKRERRRKGEKSKNAKVAFVGVLYTLRKSPAGREGPVNKRIIATFESHEALFIWLQREAINRGYGIKPCLFLADGSDHIWRLQKKYLPLAETCIDWFHIVEKVWEAGECFFPEGSKALRTWFKRMKSLLRRGQLQTVIARLSAAHRRIARTGPGTKGKRERLLKVIRHLFEHRHRMHYDSLRERDLDIGTGAVEGAVRNLIAIRLDGPGMRWGRERAERILHLRCILISGLWDEFLAHVADTPYIKLRGAPLPATPYEAKPKKAA